MYTYIYIHNYKYVCMYIYIYIYTYVYEHTYNYIYVYVYICICSSCHRPHVVCPRFAMREMPARDFDRQQQHAPRPSALCIPRPRTAP